jgi:phosphatidylethanolamine/phosphatidyl-N-methylethanolamine N-methyltransferase
LDVALQKRQVKRAYELYAPVYDLIFDWVFAPGRAAAIDQLRPAPSDTVLEIGIGTGLNLPLYPRTCRLTGIDLSGEMLDKAVERVEQLGMPNVTLKVMDAGVMDFGDDQFDKALATYTISAVPDPVSVLRELRRVVKPGGVIVILNHFRSERRFAGRLEDLVAPVCTRLGWKSNLKMAPLLKRVGLTPDVVARVNMFNGWRLIKCVNRKGLDAGPRPASGGSARGDRAGAGARTGEATPSGPVPPSLR